MTTSQDMHIIINLLPLPSTMAVAMDSCRTTQQRLSPFRPLITRMGLALVPIVA